LLILSLARKPKQCQRVFDRLSATCNVVNYRTLPAAEGVEVPLLQFNVAWFARHGTHRRQKGV
jgi:hypothetical protein